MLATSVLIHDHDPVSIQNGVSLDALRLGQVLIVHEPDQFELSVQLHQVATCEEYNGRVHHIRWVTTTKLEGAVENVRLTRILHSIIS